MKGFCFQGYWVFFWVEEPHLSGVKEFRGLRLIKVITLLEMEERRREEKEKDKGRNDKRKKRKEEEKKRRLPPTPQNWLQREKIKKSMKKRVKRRKRKFLKI